MTFRFIDYFLLKLFSGHKFKTISCIMIVRELIILWTLRSQIRFELFACCTVVLSHFSRGGVWKVSDGRSFLICKKMIIIPLVFLLVWSKDRDSAAIGRAKGLPLCLIGCSVITFNFRIYAQSRTLWYGNKIENLVLRSTFVGISWPNWTNIKKMPTICL